jgi:hypothetical protein
MATISQIINNVYSNVVKGIPEEDLATAQSLYSIIKELKGQGVTGKTMETYGLEELSKLQAVLSLEKDRFAELIAVSERNYDTQKDIIDVKKASYRKTAIDECKVKEGKATESGITAVLTEYLFKDNIRLNFLKEIHTKYLYTWRSANSIIRAIELRMSVLMREKSDTKFLGNVPNFNLEDYDDTELEAPTVVPEENATPAPYQI